MPRDFAPIFVVLKEALESQASRLKVKTDSPQEYELVSYHLMPLYMNAPLTKTIPARLKKHMQGRSCSNFTTRPTRRRLASCGS